MECATASELSVSIATIKNCPDHTVIYVSTFWAQLRPTLQGIDSNEDAEMQEPFQLFPSSSNKVYQARQVKAVSTESVFRISFVNFEAAHLPFKIVLAYLNAFMGVDGLASKLSGCAAATYSEEAISQPSKRCPFDPRT